MNRLNVHRYNNQHYSSAGPSIWRRILLTAVLLTSLFLRRISALASHISCAPATHVWHSSGGFDPLRMIYIPKRTLPREHLIRLLLDTRSRTDLHHRHRHTNLRNSSNHVSRRCRYRIHLLAYYCHPTNPLYRKEQSRDHLEPKLHSQSRRHHRFIHLGQHPAEHTSETYAPRVRMACAIRLLHP